jgi:predicted dehydrogenase
VGVVGFGYWGPNLARNVEQSSSADLAVIAEIDSAKRGVAKKVHPNAIVVDDLRHVLTTGRLDAVIIATPLSSHEEIALAALDAGCHVLVEKPIAASSQAATKLLERAASKNLVLMVDHTFIYSEPVRHIKQMVQDNELGDIHYFDSVRVNLGLFQHDSNVLWDLAVHDVSIMNHILPTTAVAVSATGMKNIASQHENVSFLTVFFENEKTIGHVHVNWLAPVKMRQTVVCGSNKMIVWDDLQPAEPVKIYDKGVEIKDALDQREVSVGYRKGDVIIPSLKLREPLNSCIAHFLECIEDAAPPTTDGYFGLEVVRVIEAAQSSLLEKGAPVEVKR